MANVSEERKSVPLKQTPLIQMTTPDSANLGETYDELRRAVAREDVVQVNVCKRAVRDGWVDKKERMNATKDLKKRVAAFNYRKTHARDVRDAIARYKARDAATVKKHGMDWREYLPWKSRAKKDKYGRTKGGSRV